MNVILVWDIPTRLFHWAFAASLTAAMGIGFLVDDDDPLFQLHMIFGIVALFLLLIRFFSHDAQTATVRLPGFGVTLRLGENEAAEGKQERDHDDD